MDGQSSDTETVPPDRQSLWLATSAETTFDTLDRDRSVETAVLGGGIVGITAAYQLATAGQAVAVVERDRIVSGTTGHTTAKLTSLHGLRYADLIERVGEERTHQYARANQRAIDHVETLVERHDIDCDFERLPAVSYVSEPGKRDRIDAEIDATRRLGLPVSRVDSTALPLDIEAGIQFAEQAQFHPRAFLLELTEQIREQGGALFERTTVTDVREGERFTVETEGGTLSADHVVVATHFPIVDRWLFFSRMSPKRSYILAVDFEERTPEAMYYRPGSPYFSVRPLPAATNASALVGGQNHRTGTGGPTSEHYRKLEAQVREHFDVTGIEYRWSTQDFVSIDGIPFVGVHRPAGEDAYVATGFGGWGMTNGIAAGRLIADEILGRGSPWAAVYRPSRLTTDGTLREFVTHNTKSARHFLTDRLAARPVEAVSELSREEGAVFDSDAGSVGLYRDENGELHAVSAVCTHLDCLVRWNDAERSWDCPCHGSRFDIDGSVIDTPAVAELEQYDLDQLELRGRQVIDDQKE